MGIWDYILLAAVTLALAAAICAVVRGKRQGRGCGGSCAGCLYRDSCEKKTK